MLAEKATSQGGTVGVTGYIGPLVSMAISTNGIAESGFLEAVESYADGCTPEVELKMETTYAGTTNPGKANISSFLTDYKAIGPKKRHRGHTLIWWSGLAKWAETFSGTEVEFKTQMLTYIKQVVEAVGQRVDSWDVLNELTDSGALRQCLYTEQLGKSLVISKTNPVMKFYAECIRVAREANPDAAYFVNEYEIETAFNYSTPTSRGNVFINFISVLQELAAENPALYGAPDGIGMQFHTNTQRLVTASELQTIVPYYTQAVTTPGPTTIFHGELVVEITEFDCQIEPGDTEAKQEEVYAAMIEGAKKAGIGRVTVWGVTDKRSWLKTQWEAGSQLTANTLEGVSILNMTNCGKIPKLGGKGFTAETAASAGGPGRVQVRFDSVTAGCGFSTGTTYWVIANPTENQMELSATETGTAIKVTAGKTLLASETKLKKYAGDATSPYPRPCPFGWTGEVKPAWRAIERSRPEQPGVGAWKLISGMTPNKVGQKSGAGIAQARTEGLNVRLSGILEATATIPTGTTIFTLPAGLRPVESRELWFAVSISGAAPVWSKMVVGTNGAVSLSLSKAEALYEPVSTTAIRLDGMTFAL